MRLVKMLEPIFCEYTDPAVSGRRASMLVVLPRRPAAVPGFRVAPGGSSVPVIRSDLGDPSSGLPAGITGISTVPPSCCVAWGLLLRDRCLGELGGGTEMPPRATWAGPHLALVEGVLTSAFGRPLAGPSAQLVPGRLAPVPGRSRNMMVTCPSSTIAAEPGRAPAADGESGPVLPKLIVLTPVGKPAWRGSRDGDAGARNRPLGEVAAGSDIQSRISFWASAASRTDMASRLPPANVLL